MRTARLYSPLVLHVHRAELDVGSVGERLRLLELALRDAHRPRGEDADIEPGEYVLSWRWDCEQTPQVWNSCADVTIA